MTNKGNLYFLHFSKIPQSVDEDKVVIQGSSQSFKCWNRIESFLENMTIKGMQVGDNTFNCFNKRY